MADFYARDSASPGRHQPISLRETLLFEKWSRTLRVCLMADFCARDSASPGRPQPTSLREMDQTAGEAGRENEQDVY